MIDLSDYIEIESLIPLCDTIFDGINEPKAGTVFCAPELIHKLFQFKDKDYVVISGASDAGLCYQAEYPVNKDMIWYSDALGSLEHGTYKEATLVPRCLPRQCKYTDRYAIKYTTLTISTFNTIPDNIIHWYLPNLQIGDDPRLTALPFGIRQDSSRYFSSDYKLDKMYVNFGNFSHSIRAQLKRHYKNLPWVAYIENAKDIQYYKSDLSIYKFVLCPKGNGLDSFRIWESIYSKAIPITDNYFLYEAFQDLPIMYVQDLFEITPALLAAHKQESHCMEKARLSYWKQRIFK